MMKIYPYLLVISSLFSLGSCEKGDNNEILPPDDEPFCYFCDTTESKLELIWHTPLHPDTLKRLSTHPALTNNQVIFTNWITPATGEGEKIIAYNKVNGEINWIKENSSNGFAGNAYSLYSFENDIVHIAGQGDICLLKDDSGEEIWCQDPNQLDLLAGAGAQIIGNKYYREYNPPGLEDQFSHLVEGDLITGEAEIIFTEYKEGDFCPTLTYPEQWITSLGVPYLIFTNYSYNWNTHDYYPDLIMMDYETREEVYRWKDLGAESGSKPRIWEDKIYITSGDSLFCIDILSKEFLWKIYTGENTTGNFLIESDVLVLNLLSDPIMGIDPNTGAILWREEDSGATSSVMTAFEGVVYFGSIGDGKLFAVDVETGEHIWAEKSPFKDELTRFQNAYFSNGVVIDPVNRILYTDDSYYAMAIKLPER